MHAFELPGTKARATLQHPALGQSASTMTRNRTRNNRKTNGPETGRITDWLAWANVLVPLALELLKHWK